MFFFSSHQDRQAIKINEKVMYISIISNRRFINTIYLISLLDIRAEVRKFFFFGKLVGGFRKQIEFLEINNKSNLIWHKIKHLPKI